MSDSKDLPEFLHLVLATAQPYAKEVFDAVDPRLEPRLVPIVVRLDVETPEITFAVDGLDEGMFASELRRVRQFRADVTGAGTGAGTPVPEILKEHLVLDELASAVSKEARRQLRRHDRVCWLSRPRRYEDVYAAVALLVRQSAADAHPSIPAESRGEFPHTLFGGVADEFLQDLTHVLAGRKPGHEVGELRRTPEDLLRAGGRLLMFEVANACDSMEFELFYRCSDIAAQAYEGGEARAVISLARYNHPSVDVQLRLEKPVRIRELRTIRKLIEIASGEFVLLSTGEVVYGFGQVSQTSERSPGGPFEVRFNGLHKWDLVCGGGPVMSVAFGLPSIPKGPIDAVQFANEVRNQFGSTADADALWEITLAASAQRHGTMIVVIEDAEGEAHRLGGQSFKISPRGLDREMVERVTAIDGALLVDPSATCHAIGVILDGLASPRGSTGRGARFNSAFRYIDARPKNPALVVVISEDGMIDIVTPAGESESASPSPAPG